jgi:hypothetical protein
MAREVIRVTGDDWGRLRRLRREALLEDPAAFGTRWEDVSRWTEEEWRL